MDSIGNIPPPRQQNLDGLNLDSKVSPSILIIIIILAIIFFICGLLHLLVRFLLRPQARDQEEMNRVTALQGQLQQLFHLHDAGLDQFFIDSTLPVFHYLDIIGSKNKNTNNNNNNDPFDCSVCLCEFEPEDKLRLLPKCSHAFHMECIDTWLLSHSTCPLCRASLVPDLTSQSSSNHVCSPVVFVLESGREQQSREINVNDSSREQGCDSELGSSRVEVSIDSGEKVVAVKLGKFRNVDDPVSEGSSSSEVTRRCYSMGHLEYVMDDESLLKVPIRAPAKRPDVSECGCESRRTFNGFEEFANLEANSRGVAGIGDAIGSSKRRESYSISKIWLRGKKDMKQSSTDGGCCGSSSRKAFSFRFPMSSSNNLSNGDDLGVVKNDNGDSTRLESGLTDPGNARIWEDGQELAKTPSFARRTLLWLVGRQSKVGNSQFTIDNC